MKRVLVIGRGSYIGRRFAEYVQGELEVDFAGARDGSWREVNFSGYEAVLMAAGLAHRRVAAARRDLYLAVNRDLPVAVAQKARRSGVGQFIFLSSLYAYGRRRGEINEGARPREDPGSIYGLAKLQAEKILAALAEESFQVAVVRPPLVYGPGCPGNFLRLAALTRWLPVFPARPNRRSMIYIDNLSRLLRLIVEHRAAGLFCPQNEEYVSTPDLVLEIARVLGRRVRLSGLLNPPVSILKRFVPLAEKVFGDLYYTQDLSRNNGLPPYNGVGFAESVQRTVAPSGRWPGPGPRPGA
ncbi:UDP-glucose 4-epimerase [Deltaproteobacteria bacterium]|nr:UDP-glucose 4-epimerase [Deltaproteobacteria bacterium]